MVSKRQLKVIHVELKEPYNGKRHYYFGSKKAIYETLPREVVGISYESFRALGDIKNHPSEKCAVRLKAVPHGVRNARTEVETVDYLIEEQ